MPGPVLGRYPDRHDLSSYEIYHLRTGDGGGGEKNYCAYFFVVLFMEFSNKCYREKKTVIEGNFGQRKSPSEEVTFELRPLKK